MSGEQFSDDMLMRFADGELADEEMAAIEQAMETDDDLVARVALFIETRAQAKASLAPLLAEPVPEKLVAAVEGMIAASRAERETPSSVVPFAAPKPAARASARHWTLPLAASIAAVLGGLAGYWVAGDGGSGPAGLAVAGIVNPSVGDALRNVPAGGEVALAGGGRFRAIASFRDEAENFCREFELDSAGSTTVVAVACDAAGEWRVSFAVSAPGDAGGYAPASSTEALDAYLTAIEAGEPLSSDAEAEALEGLRKAR
ncbi:anti-sigma factor [Mesorhizobium sp. ZMM04-5]|uniref:Anti-sigma factor n=1 Tax=Mesorhizobium marinum TaxID=3228790 RepID=A0ABV3R0X8_9HYPH